MGCRRARGSPASTSTAHKRWWILPGRRRRPWRPRRRRRRAGRHRSVVQLRVGGGGTGVGGRQPGRAVCDLSNEGLGRRQLCIAGPSGHRLHIHSSGLQQGAALLAAQCGACRAGGLLCGAAGGACHGGALLCRAAGCCQGAAPRGLGCSHRRHRHDRAGACGGRQGGRSASAAAGVPKAEPVLERTSQPSAAHRPTAAGPPGVAQRAHLRSAA